MSTDTSDLSAPPAPESALHGSIGIPGVVLLVVAAAAPLTAVGGALPVMLAIGNGAGTPVAYLVVAAVLLVFSVGYAAMSRHVTEPGAFYAYVTKGLGAALGSGAATLALVGYTAIQLAVYGLAAATMSDLVQAHGGPALPWWAWALVFAAAVAALGYRNIDVGKKILGVALILEVGVVAVLSCAILWRGGAEGLSFTTFTPGAFFQGSPGIALMFAVASFIGFEATALYGEESRNPRRTVPAATYCAVLAIGVFYAFASWAIVLAYGPAQVQAAAQSDVGGLTFAASDRYIGATYTELLRILLLTSLCAALLAFHNAISRYFHALGRRGAMSPRLARTHPTHGSPHVGSVVQTVLAMTLVLTCALLGADPVLQVFSWMSGMATVAILTLMILTSVAVAVFFARTRVDRRWSHTLLAPVLGALGLGGVLVLCIGNFTTLIDGSSGTAYVLLGVVVAAFALGAAGEGLRRGRNRRRLVPSETVSPT
ncbi:APC family permease [Rhodococcus indonesiensis]